ncbi:hypothetical protein [Nocardioides sp. Root614]|uniref:hypothetical protein n=1 Tax=Nocardioides sp. Root614 TaxID=1736571 RepID=UPI000A51707A|nr:hypothetical protein [Nocardioides sp. Root614]
MRGRVGQECDRGDAAFVEGRVGHRLLHFVGLGDGVHRGIDPGDGEGVAVDRVGRLAVLVDARHPGEHLPSGGFFLQPRQLRGSGGDLALHQRLKPGPRQPAVTGLRDLGIDPRRLGLRQLPGRLGNVAGMTRPGSSGIDTGLDPRQPQRDVDRVRDQLLRPVRRGLDPGTERCRGVLGDQRRPRPTRRLGPLPTPLVTRRQPVRVVQDSPLVRGLQDVALSLESLGVLVLGVRQNIAGGHVHQLVLLVVIAPDCHTSIGSPTSDSST